MEHTKSKKEESAAKLSFTVRQMEIEDLAEVYNLGEESFKPDLWPMLYRSWDEYEVTTLFNTDGEYCLVAENDAENPPDDERIVGFVLGTAVSKTGSAWSYGYIIWLCAHPNWMREGVASKLVDELVKIMVEEDGIRIIMADTDPANVRAVRFFEKKGFTDQKPHLYMSSNLEHNPHYRNLIRANREAALDEAYLRRIRKLAEETRFKKLLTRNRAKTKAERSKSEPTKTTRAKPAVRKKGGKKKS